MSEGEHTVTGTGISDLLSEEREFAPPAKFAGKAHVKDAALYKQADADYVAYWEGQAKALDWFAPWHTALEWTPPHCRWFLGGKLNLAHNCLDRHITSWKRHKAAIIWEGEPYMEGRSGEQVTLTYGQLHREVCKFANVLKSRGVAKGDRVAIYLPMIPEAAVAMLACARIGAVHSVVFGGFSAESLMDRINDSRCKAVVTADGGWRRGKALLLKAEVDKALADQACPSVEHVIVVQRSHGEHFPCDMQEGRDHWYHRLMAHASPDCPAEPLDSEDILYILYTSGTTGKPKGIVHTTGGYGVVLHATCRQVFDLHDADTFWCTADIGWVTGHSYVVYGPLSCGATVLMYEGAPDWPQRDRFWEIIARHRVSVFYTAPTAIRAFMKWGEQHPAKHDLSSLRLLGSVGEPINPEAWVWYHEQIGRGNCPIVDTWWQTETGGILISTYPGLHTCKPGFAGYPLAGVSATVVDDKGDEVGVPVGAGPRAKGQAEGQEPRAKGLGEGLGPGAKGQGEDQEGDGGSSSQPSSLGPRPSALQPSSGSGLLCLTRPWPAMLRTIWGDDARYQETYFSRWKDAQGNPRRDLYFPGDGAKRDSAGRYMILGRVDDVLNVAGHRIGTMEVESALVDHPAVAEAAVVGRAHEIKGQALVAFVTLKQKPSGADGPVRHSGSGAGVPGGQSPPRSAALPDAGPAARATGAPSSGGVPAAEHPHELIEELKAHVVRKIGAIAKPDDIILTADLPKTRSGKIMRRLLRDIAEGKALGDTTTLADSAVVENLRQMYEGTE